MTMTMSLSEWSAVAEHHRQNLGSALGRYHQQQLDIAEAACRRILATEHAATMRQRALALADNDTSKRKKSLYKWVIEKRDAVENICGILETCRDALLDCRGPAILSQIGAQDSDQWRDFQIRVIKKLKDDGSFEPSEFNEMNDFEDTASGCDEIVWASAMAVLEAV